jgi:Domain of unknown function (DUF4326)
MPTLVVNKHAHVPTEHDVYIGRPGPWGNPFPIDARQTREMVIEAYRAWLLQSNSPQAQWCREHIPELKNKILVCYCAPRACHGHVLQELADKIT